MGYKPVCFSECDYGFPELNWRTSVSIDTFNFADTTPFKVFWHIEPDEIKETEAKLIKNHAFYDLILSWDVTVLSQCANAKFFPCPGIWTRESDTSQKSFQCSFLTSSKTDTYGHKYRQEIYKRLNRYAGAIPLKLHKSPPLLPDKRSTLVPFQFSIIMENCQRPGYFTEKILDAFATKTIPIYYGCTDISKFFNMEGILTFDCWQESRFGSNLFSLLDTLTPDFYESKKAVIEENYQRVMNDYDRGPMVRLCEAVNEFWQPKPGQVWGA